MGGVECQVSRVKCQVSRQVSSDMRRAAVVMVGGAFVACSLTLCQPRWIMGPDGCWYYAWLRSAVFDHDWDFANERPDIAAQGSSRVGNKWSMGPAVLWAPFFAAAYAVDHALPGLVRSIPRDYLGQGKGEYARTDIPGYSFPYRLSVCVGTAFYGLLSALLVVALCRLYFGEGASWLAGLALLIATPLPFWMYKHPSWSHALSAFAVALLLATTHWSRRVPFI